MPVLLPGNGHSPNLLDRLHTHPRKKNIGSAARSMISEILREEKGFYKEVTRMYNLNRASAMFKKAYEDAVNKLKNGDPCSYDDLMVWSNKKNRKTAVIDCILENQPELVTEEVLEQRKWGDSSIAHHLVWNSRFPEDMLTEKVLKITDSSGQTIAHRLAIKGRLPEECMTDEILTLTDENGLTVGYYLAFSDNMPGSRLTEDILGLPANKGGWRVAHVLANYVLLPEENITEKVLGMTSDDGITVADLSAKRGTLPAQFWTQDRAEKFAECLVTCFADKFLAEQKEFASLLPRETKDFILSSGKIRNINGAEALVIAVGYAAEKTAEREALENLAAGGDYDIPDLY